MLSKVPEVTVWFWIIKILCTTVGESFADYINETLGFGLVPTAVLFTVVFVAVLAVQMRLRAYVPAAYWLTVVVVSVTGTLYTDILTDRLGVPLWISSTVFAVLLAAVFGAWYARERTLSIHSIDTTPRESWYWLAVLVTFALGTATGDWTLQLTGWAPGQSVLLPLTLIALVTGLWRFGANAVLSFWLAYILTRPLGANIGDWLATPAKDHGLGLGTFGTSLVFLGAILACVVYLSLSRADVVEEQAAPTAPVTSEHRQRISLAVLGLAAVATCGVLGWAHSQPHQDALAAEEGAAPTCSGPGTHVAAASAFPAADLRRFRTITQDTLSRVRSGDRSGASARATDLETAWDDAQDRLVAKDCTTWTYVDHEVDAVLTAVRASSPDEQAETGALTTLIGTLG
ncbi:hypothetical protein MRBLML1_000856 [Nocardioides sp. LML1-1-1.1]